MIFKGGRGSASLIRSLDPHMVCARNTYKSSSPAVRVINAEFSKDSEYSKICLKRSLKNVLSGHSKIDKTKILMTNGS